MSDTELAGASLPDGIEVDEAAAYFGITESSDVVHEMMAMQPVDAIEKFFSLLSDLVLKEGEFDFTLASERLNCEGGEIYYLVSHLGLMSMPDPLLRFLGKEDSMGEKGSACSLPDDQVEKLMRLTDPMSLLKLVAIGHQTGGDGESSKYFVALQSAISNPAENIDLLMQGTTNTRSAYAQSLNKVSKLVIK